MTTNDNSPCVDTKFKTGNSAWKARSSHGRNPIFADAEQLEAACYEYFQWVDDNPLLSVDVAKFQGTGNLVSVPRMRAMTVVGLCNFLDISGSTWTNYRAKPDYMDTCTRVEAIIYQQKFEGACADLLNPNFIGRELGLTDKQEVAHSGNGMVIFNLKPTSPDMDLETATRIYQDNLKALN